jgi:hypothetical protein
MSYNGFSEKSSKNRIKTLNRSNFRRKKAQNVWSGHPRWTYIGRTQKSYIGLGYATSNITFLCLT